MKNLCLIFLIIMLIANKASAQDFVADSIRSVIENAKSDSVKASALIHLMWHEYVDLSNHDTAIKVLNNALAFAKQKGLNKQEVEIFGLFGWYYCNTTDMEKDPKKGKQLTLKALSLARQHDLKAQEVGLLLDLSYRLGDKTDSIKLLIAQAFSLSVKYKLVEEQINTMKRKAYFYVHAEPDSAKSYFFQGLALAHQSHLPKNEVELLRILAYNYSNNHLDDSAKYLLQEAFRVARENYLDDQELNLLSDQLSSDSPFFLKDSVNNYYEKMLSLSRQFHRDTLWIMEICEGSYMEIGNYPKALNIEFTLMHIYKTRMDTTKIENTLLQMGFLFNAAKDFKKSNEYLFEALNAPTNEDKNHKMLLSRFIALNYLGLKQNDSARYYAVKTYQNALIYYHGANKIKGAILNDLGRVYFGIEDDSIAYDYLHRSYVEYTDYSSPNNYTETTIGLADYFKKVGMLDSSLYYAKLSFITSKKYGFLTYLTESSSLISDFYKEKHNSDSAYYYQQIAFEAYKTIYGEDNSRQLLNMTFSEQQREQDVAQAKIIAADKYAGNLRLYALLTGLLIALIVGLILYKNNLRKQKANHLLVQQKEKVESTLSELKSTQAQLIQSEKMASLGELAAGIAHEIQNPLNFINNFSEVNKELLVEMKDEIDKGNTDEAKSIADNVIANEEKINHHGKRADSIVKGMLQHSRSSSSIKEQTDINALVDEYLRLAYHGLRAKDNSFNATMETDFDKSIGNINIIPQDIGRVLLNLYNNAFYAVSEKKKSAGTSYEPTVSVTSKKTDNKINITVTDNGNGMPQKLVDKIFQPFFTTKPSGQGTGLGLSLSYDIVKAHGGEIQVNTNEGEFTAFVVQLPIS